MTEADIQKTYFRLCRSFFPDYTWIFHPPNGFLRSNADRLEAYEMGVVAGVPDVVIPYPRHGYHGMCIEFKAHDNELQDNQRKFKRHCRLENFRHLVCRSVLPAWNETLWYLAGTKRG